MASSVRDAASGRALPYYLSWLAEIQVESSHVDQQQPQQEIDVLQPIFDKFDEGHNTKDLIVAKKLLGALTVANSFVKL